MKRHPALYRLSWGHHHGLRWTLHLKRELPGSTHEQMKADGALLQGFWESDLKAHFRAEEELLLPKLGRDRKGTATRERVLPERALCERALWEHASSQELLGLIAGAATPMELKRYLLEFAVVLEDHIHFEERELFPWCERTLTVTELAAIGATLEQQGIGEGEPVLPP